MPDESSQSEFVFVYSTFPDEAAAQRVAQTLIGAQLADSVDFHGPMTSVHECQGKLEMGEEYAAFIKTRRTLAGHVIVTARPLHPYTMPCFLILPIEDGDGDHLAWVRAQT